MNYAEYAPLARRTLKELPFAEHLEHMALGFCGEMGELLGAAKKQKVYKNDLDIVNVMEEIGDICWYVVNLCKEFNFDPADMDAIYQESIVHFNRTNNQATLTQKLMWANKYFADIGESLALRPSELERDNDQAVQLLTQLTKLVTLLGVTYSIDIYQCLDANIKKLAARYGDKYTDFAALNRDLVAERAVLETAAISDTSLKIA